MLRECPIYFRISKSIRFILISDVDPPHAVPPLKQEIRTWLFCPAVRKIKHNATQNAMASLCLLADAAYCYRYSPRVRIAYGFNAHVCASPRVFSSSRFHCPVCVYIANRILSFLLPFFLQGGGGSGGAAGGLKFTVADTCERIKEEFNFIQQQYHSWVSLSLSLLAFPLSFLSLPFSHSSRFYFLLFLSFFFPYLFHCVSTSLLAISSRWFSAFTFFLVFPIAANFLCDITIVDRFAWTDDAFPVYFIVFSFFSY